MSAQLLQFPNDAVVLKNGHAVTTTMKVAEIFGKRHDKVLRAIDNLECSEEFRRANFGAANYLDKQGKSRPMYEMQKNGVAWLVTGFTGPEAARFKEAYIMAFDLMEAALRGTAPALPEPKVIEVVPTVTVNALEQAQRDTEFWKIKAEFAELKLENEHLKRQIVVDDRYYFTDADDVKLIRYKRQKFSPKKINKLHPDWKEDSIKSRYRKLRKEGKL